MKRKIIALFLTASLAAVALAGCGKVDTTGKEDTQAEETEAVAENEAETESSEEIETVIEEETTQVQPGEEHLLFVNGYDKFFIVDSKGNKVNELDISELQDSEFTEYTGVTPMEYAEGVLYLAGTYYEGDVFCKDIVAYDLESKEHVAAYKVDKEEYVNAVDFYNGKVYVATYDYKGSGDTIRTSEKVLEKDAEALKYTVSDSPLNPVLTKISADVQSDKDGAADNYDFRKCFTRELEENGYLVAYKTGILRLYDENGNETGYPMDEDDYVSIVGYDSDDILINVTRYDIGKTERTLYCFDPKSGEKKIIDDSSKASTILYTDGFLYYYTDLSEEFGINNNHVYRYDPASNSSSLIYETRNVPGAVYNPGITGFTVINGEVYFVDVMDRSFKWVRVNYDESGASYTDIYCTLKEIDKLKYGDVEYVSKTVKCPDCDTPLNKEYVEYFVFNDSVAHSAEINAELKAQADLAVENYEDYGTTCEEHLEYPEQFCVTEETRVDNIRFIGENYVSVDRSGYWYGGGAHGMPWNDYILFDLTTGEQKSLRDFYSGSDEDFANLMAEVAVRELETNKEFSNQVYNNEKEAVEASVKESTTLDNVTIKFEDKGVYVEYMPYVLGPFASGFVDLFVSYEELLGRDSL